MKNWFLPNAKIHGKRYSRLKKTLCNVAGSNFWNLLPQAFMEADSMSRFKKGLDKFKGDKIVNGY